MGGDDGRATEGTDRHPRFSANTGFLYPELDFLERIRAATRDGFDAVEFHDEGQRTDREALKDCLAECALPVLGLNVAMAPTAGCAAIPSLADKARRDIDEAIALAEDINAAAVHVLAGRTDAPGAREAYLDTLRYALASSGRTILIEPLCTAAMTDYWLHSLDIAAEIVDELGGGALKILFDCYHVEMEHGDTLARFREHVTRIGHVQIASVPERTEPRVGGGAGALDYATLLPAFREAGYDGAFGCEYRPVLDAALGLDWRYALTGHGDNGST